MKFKISTLIRLCALVLIILFFVPTGIASCSSYGITASVDISPFNLAIGNLKMETNDPDETADEAEAIESIEAKPVLFVMLALSAVVVALGSKVPILGAILSVGNAVAIFIMHLKIAEYIATEYEGMSVELEKTAAYYIYIIVAVVIAVILMLVNSASSVSRNPKQQSERTFLRTAQKRITTPNIFHIPMELKSTIHLTEEFADIAVVYAEIMKCSAVIAERS